MPTWPSDLPCMPIAGSLQTDIEPNVAEFKPDVGRPQRSMRYTQSRRPYSFEMSVTSAQRAILDDFFSNSKQCAGGAISFDMRDVADLTSTPATKRFTWTSPPSFRQMAPDRFSASIQITRED